MPAPIFVRDGFYGSTPGRLIGRALPVQDGVSGLQWSAVSAREVTTLPAPEDDGEGGYVLYGHHSMYVDGDGTIKHEKELGANTTWDEQISGFGGP